MLLTGLAALHGAGVENAGLTTLARKYTLTSLLPSMRTKEALATLPQITCALHALGGFRGPAAGSIASQISQLPIAQLEDWELCVLASAFRDEDQRLFGEAMRQKREARKAGLPKPSDQPDKARYTRLLRVLQEEIEFRRIQPEQVEQSLRGPGAFQSRG